MNVFTLSMAAFVSCFGLDLSLGSRVCRRSAAVPYRRRVQDQQPLLYETPEHGSTANWLVLKMTQRAVSAGYTSIVRGAPSRAEVGPPWNGPFCCQADGSHATYSSSKKGFSAFSPSSSNSLSASEISMPWMRLVPRSSSNRDTRCRTVFRWSPSSSAVFETFSPLA